MGRYGFARAVVITVQFLGAILFPLGIVITLYGLGQTTSRDYIAPQVNWSGIATTLWGVSSVVVSMGLIGAGQMMSALLDVAENTFRLDQMLHAIADEVAMANTRLREITQATQRTANAVEILAQTVRKT